jgi:hypothetical protein
MIVWLASYPKSGNTWIRSLLSSYLYSKDGTFTFNLLEKIKQFPSKQYFEYFTKDFTNIKKISDYWIASQDRINLVSEDVVFLKTHSALCTLEKNQFTNKNNTKAIIYIVRDPRNLITSLSNHYSLSLKDSLDFMSNKNKMIIPNENQFGIATVLGDWSEHYKSWKNSNIAPILIIKYEDLLKDTISTFTSVVNFLSSFIKIEIDKKKIVDVVDNCKFETLSAMEKKYGFFESMTKNDKKINFFFLGQENNWQSLLKPEIENKIKKNFEKEMKELDYIK